MLGYRGLQSVCNSSSLLLLPSLFSQLLRGLSVGCSFLPGSSTCAGSFCWGAQLCPAVGPAVPGTGGPCTPRCQQLVASEDSPQRCLDLRLPGGVWGGRMSPPGGPPQPTAPWLLAVGSATGEPCGRAGWGLGHLGAIQGLTSCSLLLCYMSGAPAFEH